MWKLIFVSCGFFTVNISCRQRLRQDDIVQAEQSLSELHVNSSDQTHTTAEQQWIAVMYLGLFCAFFLIFCLSEAGTGQDSSCARLRSSYPQPQQGSKAAGIRADADGCAPRCTFPARKLSWECWKPAGKPEPTRGIFAEACAAKRSQEEFSSVNRWSHRVLLTRDGRTCCVGDSVQDLGVSWLSCPCLPLKEGTGSKAGNQKILTSLYEVELALQSLRLLIGMWHHLGNVSGKWCDGCPLLRITCAERVWTPEWVNTEDRSLLPQ